MSDEYRVRNIDLDKLSSHVRSTGRCTEEAALHLIDTIRVLREELQYERNTIHGLAAANTSQSQAIEELEQQVCDVCPGDGWVENRVEGRGACVCMTEAEPANFRVGKECFEICASVGLCRFNNLRIMREAYHQQGCSI